MIRTAVALILLMVLSAATQAEVELQSQGMTVFGQSELPKVLYIVPWKHKELPNIEQPQTISLSNDMLTPFKPEIFERQVRYYEMMMQRIQKQQ